MQNNEAGPSMPGAFLFDDQLRIDTLCQEDDGEIDAIFGDLNIAGEHAFDAATPSTQPTPSHPNVTFNTHASASVVNNVYGNYYHDGVPPAASDNPMHSLSPFNDAPVDRISPSFMGREDDVQAFASAFVSCDGDAPFRYAVWGMPGLGKSQLALRYAHLSFKIGRHTHIIWIAATTLEKVNQGFVKVLDLTQHADRNTPDQAARLTAARLFLERSGQQLKWLLILDDVTLATLPFLCEHLPRQNAHGSILITTRTLDVAEAFTRVAGQQYPVHQLKALSPAHSAELLFERAGIHSSTAADLDNAQKLVKRMGCLPLAVDQAGAYMKRSGLTGARQLEALLDQQGLQEVISWDNSLSTYAEKSVSTTVIVQLQRLGEIDPHLLELLHVLAFFDPESIPLDIIIIGARRVGRRLHASELLNTHLSLIPKPIRSRISRRYQPSIDALPSPDISVASAGVSVELRPLLRFICSEPWLRGALRHLEDLSLARPLYGERTSLHIHELIQFILQQRTATDPPVQDPYWALAVTLLCGAFETIEDVHLPRCWPECERFVSHLMSFAKRETPTIAFLAMCVQVAGYFASRGRYDESEILYQRALAGQEQQLGADHLNTLLTAHNLAMLFNAQGRYDESEILYQRALAGQERQLGADHLNTLLTAHNLAILYKNQGWYDESEPLYRRVLGGQERQLGAEHLDTLLTAHNLAILYMKQGRYDKAEPLFQRALAGKEQQLGADHLNTLLTLHGLALLYEQQGRHGEAEIMYQRALAGFQRQLREDHPVSMNTLYSTVLYNIADFRVQQGRYQEAETLYSQALTGMEKTIGHPHTLDTIEGLTQVYDKQGRLQEARMMRERALKWAE